MRRGLALWLICLSLISARVLGLHLHVCEGVETGVAHAGTHFADNGLLFGDYHAQDDADDQEVEIALGIAPTPVHFELLDLSVPIPAVPAVRSTAEQLLTTLSPRGPPAALPGLPPHFVPPLRAPPADSLA